MADRKAQLPDATMQKKYIFTYWYHHFSGEEEQVPEEAISGAGRLVNKISATLTNNDF